LKPQIFQRVITHLISEGGALGVPIPRPLAREEISGLCHGLAAVVWLRSRVFTRPGFNWIFDNLAFLLWGAHVLCRSLTSLGTALKPERGPETALFPLGLTMIKSNGKGHIICLTVYTHYVF